MDLLTAFNFLEIQNAKDADKAARKLDDLKDEAEHLQKQGLPVKSWYEFKREVAPETDKPKYTKNILTFGGLGAAAFGALSLAVPPLGLALVPAVLSGGLIGGLIGGYQETENSQRLNKVDDYEHYLEQANKLSAAGISPDQLQALADKAHAMGMSGEAPEPNVSDAVIIANHAKQHEHGYAASA